MKTTKQKSKKKPALQQGAVSGRAERMAKLKEAAKPLFKLLCEEYHPHHTAFLKTFLRVDFWIVNNFLRFLLCISYTRCIFAKN